MGEAREAFFESLDRHTLADFMFVDTWPQGHNRTHVLMTWCEVLIKGGTAVNFSGRAVMDNFQISRTNCHRINAHQNLSFGRSWHVFIDQ